VLAISFCKMFSPTSTWMEKLKGHETHVCSWRCRYQSVVGRDRIAVYVGVNILFLRIKAILCFLTESHDTEVADRFISPFTRSATRYTIYYDIPLTVGIPPGSVYVVPAYFPCSDCLISGYNSVISMLCAGWLVKIELSDLSEADELMSADQYQEMVKEDKN